MKFINFKLFQKNQGGFTLIEMLAALAITGLISLGASIATGQVLNQTSRNNDYTTASRNTLNALHWISRDVTMAQTIDGWEGFPQSEDLSLSWIGWDNTEYSANYTLDNGILRRVYSEGGQVNTTFIAENINSNAALTNCTSHNGTVTVTITCSVGAGDKIVNVTKVRIIASRPNL
jgi:prepilin-type N-terminal cleavage/methylation domain-containing protein